MCSIEKLAISCGGIKKSIQKNINSFLKSYNITSNHVPYIIYLKKLNGATMYELNNCLNVDKAHTTRVIKFLEESNLVYKTLEKRGYKIFLTNQGLKMNEILENKMIDIKKQALRNISCEKIDVFIDVLLQINTNLEGE